MEPISTVLTGMALVKQSVDFIKGHIDTAKDIGEIFGHVDNLLNGEKQIQQTRFGKSTFGQTKDAAQAVIDAKLAQEAMDEMHTLIDNRFGFGTWSEIIELRNQRIREEKEEQQRIARQRKKKREEMQQMGMIFASSLGGLLLIGGLIFVGLLMFDIL